VTLSLLEWLEERRDNTIRIALTKSGSYRTGWIEDAAYFQAAIIALTEGYDANRKPFEARSQTTEEPAK
jgi:hypothetical protein